MTFGRDLFSSDSELASLLTPQNIGIAMGLVQKLPTERRADMAYVQQVVDSQSDKKTDWRRAG